MKKKIILGIFFLFIIFSFFIFFYFKSISEKDLDIELINSEKDIIKQQLKDSGKPENILKKMRNKLDLKIALYSK